MKVGPENSTEARAAVNPVTMRSLRQRIKYVHMPWLEKASFDGVISVIFGVGEFEELDESRVPLLKARRCIRRLRRKNSQLLVF